jgi:hypothetical protein
VRHCATLPIWSEARPIAFSDTAPPLTCLFTPDEKFFPDSRCLA